MAGVGGVVVLLSEGCGMRCRVEERPSVAGALP
jgi:hypothetical protein